MMANKVLCGTFVFISLASLSWAETNPLDSFAIVSQNIVDLSRITQCLANKGDNAELIAKVYHVYDNTVAGIKENVDGPLTPEKFNTLVKILVSNTYDQLKPIDPQCKAYCPQDDDESHGPKEVSDLGKALEKQGLTLSCLLDDPNPEALAQLPAVVGAALQSLAANSDPSLTSVGVLIPDVNAIVKGFQKLSPRCVNIKRKC